MNQSEMIRSPVDKLVINPVIKFSPVKKELLSKADELIPEGKRMGNNLNQIARALNSDSFDPGITTEIRRALGDVAEWKYEILQEVKETGEGMPPFPFNSCQNAKLFIPGSCRCRDRRQQASRGRSGRR